MAAEKSHLYIRVDAGAGLGTGHFMRCLALAQYWHDEGGQATFLGAYPAALSHRLQVERISAHAITAAHPDERDVEETVAMIPPGVPVVLDGYHFDAAYHYRLGENGRRLLIVDDTGHLDAYGGDMLLNQNVNAGAVEYRTAPATRLLGTRYALLGRPFRDWADERATAQPKHARNLLVTMGGADPNNDTLNALRALADTNVAGFSVRVVAGAANSHVDDLRSFCDTGTLNCELVVDTTEMPSLMAWADLAIAASGSTCWELAYMRVPTVYVAIAANQAAVGEGMASQGAGVYIGLRAQFDWGHVAETALALATDRDRRFELAEAAGMLVDGQGVVRVAEKLRQH